MHSLRNSALTVTDLARPNVSIGNLGELILRIGERYGEKRNDEESAGACGMYLW
jgi:hypothetical protein